MLMIVYRPWDFMKENSRDPEMPRKMVEYLIGVNDYYKVVSHDSKRLTIIHTFNLHETLNKPSGRKVSSITVPVIDLPTELVAIKFKTNSTNVIKRFHRYVIVLA